MTKGKYFIILSLMLGMGTASLSKQCSTPQKENGLCIKILDCPILLTLLKLTTKSSDIGFLQKSLCGFDGKDAKVCCPLVTPENKPLPVTTINTIRMNTEKPNELTKCTTPKSEKGVCINLQDCSILRTHFPSNQDFLQKSVCGYKAKKPKVCCPMENESPPVTPNVIENVIILPLHTTYETSKPILTNAENSKKLSECTTPKSEKGVCIKIHDCPIFLTLVNHTNDLSNLDFLQKSFCGYKDKTVVVCCPLVQPENKCGMRHIRVDQNQFRIFGGKEAKLGYWPWIAALGYKYKNPKNHNILIHWNCGGTLISSKHVLTAAHCIPNKHSNSNLTTVRLGDLDLNDTVNDMARPLDVPVQSITVHPNYDRKNITNDIALLTLQDSVSFTELIQPICLPIESNIRDSNLAGKLLTVAGWGNTEATPSYTEPPNTVLMEIEVPVLSTEDCNQLWSNIGFKINDKMLCAGFKVGGKDSCRGDSGGPLMLENGNQYFLMGIVSFGSVVCGRPGIPGVYTNVPLFLDWILETKKKV